METEARDAARDRQASATKPANGDAGAGAIDPEATTTIITGGDGAARREVARPTVEIASAPDREAIAPIEAPSPRERARRRGIITVPTPTFDERVGRFILSILLATLLWFYVVNLENPEQTTIFRNLAIDIVGINENMKVINALPDVDATVQAPQNVMAGLTPSDIRPYIDLTGLTAGVHQEVPVRATVEGRRADTVNVSLAPAVVEVQLELQASRVFSVEVQTAGTPAIGYSMEPPQVDPAQVQVTGSSEALGRIAKVVAQVDIDGESKTQRGSRTPVALDSNGREIAGVTFEPATVQVVVPVQLLFNHKVVPVRVPVEGQPAAGYRVSAIIIDPTNVTICCLPRVLEPIQFLDTEPIGITGTTFTVVTTTQLLLPTGVDLSPGQSRTVNVTVSVEALETTLQVSVAPTVEGLPEDMSAVVSPDRLELVLAGTFTQLQSLRPTDVRAIVRMQGRGPGTYELQPQIIVPQGVKLERSTPERLTVTVIAPSPLPTSTPTVAPAVTPTAAPGAGGSPGPPATSPSPGAPLVTATPAPAPVP